MDLFLENWIHMYISVQSCLIEFLHTLAVSKKYVHKAKLSGSGWKTGPYYYIGRHNINASHCFLFIAPWQTWQVLYLQAKFLQTLLSSLWVFLVVWDEQSNQTQKVCEGQNAVCED